MILFVFILTYCSMLEEKCVYYNFTRAVALIQNVNILSCSLILRTEKHLEPPTILCSLFQRGEVTFVSP